MRIIILATAALSIISITQASYILNIPMEQGQGQGQGGALSNGSIKFTTRTPPIPVEPLLGEWVDKGLPINCSAWTPLPNTVNKDQSFEQSSTCSQEQTRTVEEQVKNLDTGVISKTGNKSEESQTISVVKKQSVKCVYGFNWGAGYWIESSNNTTNFMWYGPSFGYNETLNKTLAGHPTSYTQAGYTYRRGLYNNGSGGGNIYYSICRE